MCLTICSYVSRNFSKFCLLVYFQSSFTPWNHMLANISTFLQLSLQYCCTALHLPKILPLCIPLLHSIIISFIRTSMYLAHILHHGGLYRWRENSLPIFLFRKLKEILTRYSRTISKASKNWLISKICTAWGGSCREAFKMVLLYKVKISFSFWNKKIDNEFSLHL